MIPIMLRIRNTKKMDKQLESKVAYICDGLDPKCSGKLGCFKCLAPDFGNGETCFHTLDPSHAVYGGTLYPSVWAGSRFKVYPTENELRYFEEWDEAVIKELCASKQILLLPNEPIRMIWLSKYGSE